MTNIFSSHVISVSRMTLTRTCSTLLRPPSHSITTTMSTSPSTSSPIDLLILGAGWTSTFLIPLCISEGITYAATSRSPSKPKSPYPTIPFEFDPLSDDPEPFKSLPDAKTVLITFPIRVGGASERLVRLYRETRTSGGEAEVGGVKTGFIQLGSTGIWDVSLTFVYSYFPPS